MARTSTKADGRPSFQFYPDAWLTDAALRLCPLAARGLWPDMLCIMWRSPRRGYLLKPNGSKFEANDLAKLTGDSEQEIKQALDILGENEVYSTDESGVIYCRRMVREAAISEARSEAGRKGGLFKPSSKTASKREANTEATAKQNPRASSPSPSPSPDSESRKGNTELNREGREDSPLKSSGIQTKTETQTAAGFVPPEPDPAPPRQHPEAMIRDMAFTRDVPWDQVLEHAGGPPPWGAHTVTELRAWLQPLPRFTEAHVDQRRASRRQRDGPPGQPVHVGEVAQRIMAEAGEEQS